VFPVIYRDNSERIPVSTAMHGEIHEESLFLPVQKEHCKNHWFFVNAKR
jgi:hypothetical protein